MKSEKGKAAYWRMQYASAIGALSDLIAENTENVEFARDFYSNNADLLNDYWRAEFTRVFPPGGGRDEHPGHTTTPRHPGTGDGA